MTAQQIHDVIESIPAKAWKDPEYSDLIDALCDAHEEAAYQEAMEIFPALPELEAFYARRE